MKHSSNPIHIFYKFKSIKKTSKISKFIIQKDIREQLRNSSQIISSNSHLKNTSGDINDNCFKLNNTLTKDRHNKSPNKFNPIVDNSNQNKDLLDINHDINKESNSIILEEKSKKLSLFKKIMKKNYSIQLNKDIYKIKDSTDPDQPHKKIDNTSFSDIGLFNQHNLSNRFNKTFLSSNCKVNSKTHLKYKNRFNIHSNNKSSKNKSEDITFESLKRNSGKFKEKEKLNKTFKMERTSKNRRSLSTCDNNNSIFPGVNPSNNDTIEINKKKNNDMHNKEVISTKEKKNYFLPLSQLIIKDSYGLGIVFNSGRRISHIIQFDKLTEWKKHEEAWDKVTLNYSQIEEYKNYLFPPKTEDVLINSFYNHFILKLIKPNYKQLDDPLTPLTSTESFCYCLDNFHIKNPMKESKKWKEAYLKVKSRWHPDNIITLGITSILDKEFSSKLQNEASDIMKHSEVLYNNIKDVLDKIFISKGIKNI